LDQVNLKYMKVEIAMHIT